MIDKNSKHQLEVNLLSNENDELDSEIQIVHVTVDQDSTCKFFIKKLFKIISIILSFTMIAGIISELLLLINVYSSNTGFFIISSLFLILPLSMVSCTIGCCSWFNAINVSMDGVDFNLLHCLMCIPILNIPLISTYAKISSHVSRQHLAHLSLIDALLTGMMTFPLYIINLSFLLESVSTYAQIETFNIAQLIISLCSFILNPIKLSLATTAIKYGRRGLDIGIKIKIILCASFVFGPIVLIEVIHFFPFCFAHYVDNKLNAVDLLLILLMFNIPKLIFIYDVLNKQWQNSDVVQYTICEKILFSIVPTIIFATIPLVPYIILMYNYNDKNQQDKKQNHNVFKCCDEMNQYYWKLMIYLFIAYGGSCIYVIVKLPLYVLSEPVIISIACIMVLLLFIAVTFPLAFYLLRQNNVKFFDTIEYTSFGLQMDKL